MKKLVLTIFVIFLVSMSIPLTIADNSDETYTYKNRHLDISLSYPVGIAPLWEYSDEVCFAKSDIDKAWVKIGRTYLSSKPLEDYIRDQIPEEVYEKGNTGIVAGKTVYVFANISFRYWGTRWGNDQYREIWFFEHSDYAYRIDFITWVWCYKEINAEYFEPMKKSFRLTSLSEPILTLTPPTVIPTPTPSLSPTPMPSPTPTPVSTPVPSSTPTPTPTPGFEAVFATVGVLAVAYLLKRRK